MKRKVCGMLLVLFVLLSGFVAAGEAAPFAYILNRDAAPTISVIDTATDQVTSTLPVDGDLLLGVAVNSAGTKAYISRVHSTNITVLNIPEHTVAATFSVAGTVHCIAVSPDGSRLYVAIRDSGIMQVLDAVTGDSITTISGMNNPTGIAVSPDGSRVYVANWGGSVVVVDAATDTAVTTISGLQSTSGIAVNHDGSRVYVCGTSSLFVIDTSTNNVTEIPGVGGSFIGVAVSADGSRVYAGSGSGVAVIDTSSNSVITTVVTVGTPSGIDINPAGTKVYAAIPSSNSVQAIDTSTNTISATISVGSSPYPLGKFIVPNNGCVAAPSGLVSWWGGDDNALDIIGVNNGTPMNGANYAAGKVGRAFSFDGADDYVEIAGNAGDVGASQFSVDFWMYASGDPSSDAYLLGKSHPDGGQGWDIRFDDNVIKVVGVNGWGFNIVSDASVALNTWHHIAVASTDTLVTLYIDGVVKGTSPRSGISSTSNPFRIGYTSNYGGSGFNGLIDEVRIFNRALIPTEIATIYNAGSAGMCRPSVSPPSGLISWWKGENNALDIIGANNGTMVNGATFATGKVGQAFSFDGVDDYVEVPHAASLNLTSGLTLGTWFNLRSADAALFSKGDSNGSQSDFSYGLSIMPDGSINLALYGTYPADWWKTAAGLVTTGQWYHVATTWDGTNGPSNNVKLYLNGTLIQTWTKSPAPLNVTNQTLTLGSMKPPSFYHHMDGLIDEVVIFDRALTADEIATIYNAGSSGMTSIDTDPDSFTFTNQVGMPLSTSIVSNPITVTGINYLTPISITACTNATCEYKINSGSWTSSAGTVINGDTVIVRQTSSSNYSTLTTATLTIGGVSGAFNVTTAASGDPNASGLVAWWKAENNALDSVGGNHGSATGGATYASGQIGQAFSLDGANGHVNVPNSSLWNFGSNNFTIDLWVKFDQTKDNFLIAHDEGGGSQNKWAFYVGNGYLNFHLNSPGTGPISIGYGSIPFSYNMGQWYNLAVTRNGDTYTFYVDGASVGTVTDSNVLPDANAPLTIGQGEGIHYVDGSIDEVKIFNRALSSVEVATLAGTNPDAFSFTTQTGVPLSTPVESNVITVTGISNPAAVSITGGEYQINGGSWTASAGTVNNGDTLKVRQTSSSAYAATTDATLTIGGVSDTFSITTIPWPDVYSDNFTSGINPTHWTVDAGAYTIDSTQGDIRMSKPAGGGPWGSVRFNHVVYGDFDISVDYRDAVLAGCRNQIQLNLSFGGQYVANRRENWCESRYSVWLDPGGTVGVMGTTDTSGTLRVTRVGSTVTFYANATQIYQGVFNNSPVTDLWLSLQNNGTEDAISVTFDNFTVNASDIVIPDAFTFTAQTGVALSTPVESNALTVTGITNPAALSITGGEYSVSSNGGSIWSAYSTSTPSTVSLNDQVKVRLTSSASYSTVTTATLTIGGVSGAFSVTTMAIPSYAINASVSGGHGSISCDTPVNQGAESECMITPEANYHLATLTDNGADVTGSVSGGIAYEINNVTSGHTVVATFAINTYQLTVVRAGTGSGVVTSNPGGISCGSTCAYSFNANAVVILTAVPDSTSTFVGWSGGVCSGTGICAVTMNAAKSATANFTRNTYQLTVSKPGTGSGTVTSNPGPINCGATCSASFTANTSVTLTANAAAGSTAAWAGCDTTGGTQTAATCTVNMTAPKTVTATFTLTQYSLTANAAGNGSGTVTSTAGGISYAYPAVSTASANLNSGTAVTLTAQAAAGSRVAWSGNCDTRGGTTAAATCTITGMNAAKTVTATFSVPGWTQIPGAIVSPPAIAWNPVSSKLQMVVRGSGDSIWSATFNSNGTFNEDWTHIPGAIISPPAIAWNPVSSKLQMVVRGSGDSIWSATFNSNGTFNEDWTHIPGAIVSPPALAWDPLSNNIQMLVRGSGDTIWTATFNSTGAFNEDWTQIPGAIIDPPAIVWNPVKGNLLIVVRGMNNTIWAMEY